MDSNLNILEAKVLEAVELIKELRSENKRLTERNAEYGAELAEMEARLSGLEAENTQLSHDLEEASQRAGAVGNYEEKRKEIEDKVGGLLAKLEGLG